MDRSILCATCSRLFDENASTRCPRCSVDALEPVPELLDRLQRESAAEYARTVQGDQGEEKGHMKPKDLMMHLSVVCEKCQDAYTPQSLRDALRWLKAHRDCGERR